MPDEKPMSLAEQNALFAEIRADEHAARVRDYGEPDAASYEQRVKEGAVSVRHLSPEPPPVGEVEMERQSIAPKDSFKAIMRGDTPTVEQPSHEPERGHTR